MAQQVVVVDDITGEAGATTRRIRLDGVEYAPGHDHVEGTGDPDDARQQVRAAVAGDQPQLDERRPEILDRHSNPSSSRVRHCIVVRVVHERTHADDLVQIEPRHERTESVFAEYGHDLAKATGVLDRRRQPANPSINPGYCRHPLHAPRARSTHNAHPAAVIRRARCA